MPKLTTLAVALALIASAAITAIPAEAKRAKCARAGSTTVVENDVARVYTRFEPDFQSSGRALLGCLKKTGRLWELAHSTDDLDVFEDFDAVRLSGRFVAWYAEFQDSCRYGCPPDYDNDIQLLRTTDLRSGEESKVELPEAPAGMQLGLDAQGAIAWPMWLPHNQVEIRVRDGAGERAVASGAIHPESLSLYDDGTLRWVDDGTVRTVQLQRPPPDTTDPQLSRLRVTARDDSEVRFTLSEYATVHFTIRRRKGTRSVPLKGSFTRSARAGSNLMTFDGRLRGRRLRPGSYVLVARATDYSGNHSQTLRAKFRIVRRR